MVYYERNGVVVRDATGSDVDDLGRRLRDADEKEVIAAGSASGLEALRYSFSRSERPLCVVVNGTVAAMWGVVPDPGGTICGGSPSGNVWFLGAPEMSRIKKTFVRLSRQYIAERLDDYTNLWNVVDSRYEATLAWLKSCGAEFGDKNFEINGIDFIPFAIRRA